MVYSTASTLENYKKDSEEWVNAYLQKNLA